ncbi:MAG: hypothetical protein KJO07_09015 [Deltaproteobacteria bacterium]|nr:hypothetical protein [Deltaproteobacteria bacterium]
MFRRNAILLAVVLALSGACGGSGKPPKRGVIEADVEAWGFRRYQAVLDPEVWVKKNKSKGYTASYVKKQAEKRGRLEDGDVASAFVTRFKRKSGVVQALVKFTRRLAQESGYVVEEDKLSGTRLIVVKGHGELWAWWASKRHLVKVGGPGVEKVPEQLVEAYADRYPSTLKGGVLDMELDVEDEEPELESEDYNPDSPTPDWDHKQPKKKKKNKKRRKKKRK